MSGCYQINLLKFIIPGRIYDFPDISIRVPGTKCIVRANNIRQSKEMFIMGIIFLCMITYLFVSVWSQSPYPFPAEIIWVFYGGGISILCSGWLIRSSSPGFFLPSELLWDIIKAIPLGILVAIPLVILAVLIYHWFGRETLINVFLIAMCLFMTFGLWFIPYTGITTLLEKKKTKYNAVLVGVLASIPSLAFLSLCVRVFFLYWW